MNVVKDCLGSYEKVLINKFDFPSYSNDGRFMAINDKYFVLANQNSSLNIYKHQYPLNSYTNHKVDNSYSNIYDMEFSPFYNNILACGFDNNSVFLIKLTELSNGIFPNSTRYQKHTKKVNFLNFNPIVNNLICSSTSYGEVHIWDAQMSKTIEEFKVYGNPNVVSWNTNGSLIGISLKNKYFNIIDPRTKELIFNAQISHQFSNSKFAWIDDNNIVTLGWNKFGRRTVSILDTRNCLLLTEKALDNYSTVTMPYVDPELKLIYTIGNGDSYIKVFDYSNGNLDNIYNNKISKPNVFSILLNRRYLNKKDKEIDRFIQYTKDKIICYTSFGLNKDIDIDILAAYPNENLAKPQLTIDEWKKGEKAELIPQKLHKAQNSKNEIKEPTNENIKSNPKGENFVYDKFKNFDRNNSNNIQLNQSAQSSGKPNVKITINTKRSSLGKANSITAHGNLNPSNDEYTLLVDENNDLKNEIQQLNKEKKELTELYNEVLDYNNKFNSKNENLESKLKEYKEKINKYENQLSNYNELNQKYNSLKSDLDEKYLNLKVKYNDKIIELNDLKIKYINEKDKSSKYEKNFSNLKNQITEYNKKKDLTKENEKNINKMALLIEKFKNEEKKVKERDQ